MKTVILCGGLGTRLAEETQIKPKPMVEVGSHPILWHIMKIYEQFGYGDFVLPLGYKGHVIKNYFLNYRAYSSDVAVNIGSGETRFFGNTAESWNVTMLDTGADTLTGGRLKRLESLLRPSGTFMLTYGDGVANVDIEKLVRFHKQHGGVATMTAVRPTARFGTMTFDQDRVTSFTEKSQTEAGWINGGFFVFEPEIFDYLQDDQTILERDPLERLAQAGQLHAFKHDGFWQCMDTLRDKKALNQLVNEGCVPWLAIKQKHATASEETVIA
jgi:glucose-1-phosphate cytidylyltransferase